MTTHRRRPGRRRDAGRPTCRKRRASAGSRAHLALLRLRRPVDLPDGRPADLVGARQGPAGRSPAGGRRSSTSTLHGRRPRRHRRHARSQEDGKFVDQGQSVRRQRTGQTLAELRHHQCRHRQGAGRQQPADARRRRRSPCRPMATIAWSSRHAVRPTRARRASTTSPAVRRASRSTTMSRCCNSTGVAQSFVNSITVAIPVDGDPDHDRGLRRLCAGLDAVPVPRLHRRAWWWACWWCRCRCR